MRKSEKQTILLARSIVIAIGSRLVFILDRYYAWRSRKRR